MILGYNTNGLAHHALPAAIRLLAEIGYRSVGISLDHGALNPLDKNLAAETTEIQELLQLHSMRSTLETGCRFLLNPVLKHEPTLMTAEKKERARRIDFYCRTIDLAVELGSDSVSLWSGILREKISEEEGFNLLVEGLTEVLSYAKSRNMTISFEPEPGMFIATMDMYAKLLKRLASFTGPENPLRLTLDLGHLHCLGEVPIDAQISCWSDQIVNIHIEDMLAGEHEHLMFGKGEIDFSPIIRRLVQVNYQGPLHVELSRHSHVGPTAAILAYRFLRPLLDAAQNEL